jgi:FixJ family two-component response regulator
LGPLSFPIEKSYARILISVIDNPVPQEARVRSVRPVVYAVDDDESMLRSLWRLLSLAGYETRTFASAAEFLENVDTAGYGCVLLDLRMPGMSGLEALDEMKRIGCSLPLIFVSGTGDIPSAVKAVKEGAIDFLTKPVDGSQLLATISAALERHRAALEAGQELLELRSRFARLSDRERDVCLGVARGLLNKQIAGELGISEKTVKIHRGRVTKKMCAGSVAELVQMLARLGAV